MPGPSHSCVSDVLFSPWSDSRLCFMEWEVWESREIQEGMGPGKPGEHPEFFVSEVIEGVLNCLNNDAGTCRENSSSKSRQSFRAPCYQNGAPALLAGWPSPPPGMACTSLKQQTARRACHPSTQDPVSKYQTKWEAEGGRGLSMWVLGTELRSSGLVASTFTH